MNENFKLKASISEEMFASNFNLGKGISKTLNLDPDQGTSYEVFRNNTTAVEVIVKEMPKSKKRVMSASTPSEEGQDMGTVKKLQGEIDKLKVDLHKTNNSLVKSRRGFLAIVGEMKKQIDATNQRELDVQTKNLALQLENEKLKTMLASQSNLLYKFKKELHSMKRVMRFVIKSICHAPQLSESLNVTDSDPEYDDFENYLKKETKNKVPSMFEETGTCDSTVSKDASNKYSCDKRKL